MISSYGNRRCEQVYDESRVGAAHARKFINWLGIIGAILVLPAGIATPSILGSALIAERHHIGGSPDIGPVGLIGAVFMFFYWPFAVIGVVLLIAWLAIVVFRSVFRSLSK
jgi:hypothetical protein